MKNTDNTGQKNRLYLMKNIDNTMAKRIGCI